MKNSRRFRANALNAKPRTGAPPVTSYAIKTLGLEAAQAAHAAAYGPQSKPQGGVTSKEA